MCAGRIAATSSTFPHLGELVLRRSRKTLRHLSGIVQSAVHFHTLEHPQNLFLSVDISGSRQHGLQPTRSTYRFQPAIEGLNPRTSARSRINWPEYPA